MELALLNVRSRFNVGAMMRTCDAVGIKKIYLLGYTPGPPHKDISKVALGAEKTMGIKKHKSALDFVRKMQKIGYRVIALEITKKSQPYYRYRQTGKRTILLVGNEITGIDKKVLRLCDDILSIPMAGKKESLNVGIAFGIVAYRLKYP